jgi:exonuclease SbcC
MIKWIKLVNFQRHAKTVLRLSERVTCLTGRSDGGKSSVVRALRWLCFNRPLGSAFVRYGQDHAKVVISCDDDVIVRSRGKENLYIINKQRMKAVGKDVPEEVQLRLNLDDINFQSQHDPPFWLTLSPIEVSRALNEIINLGHIDRALFALSSQQREAKSKIEVIEDRLAKAELIRNTLNWTNEAHAALVRVEQRAEMVTALHKRRESLRAILDGTERIAPLISLKLPLTQLLNVEQSRKRLKLLTDKIGSLRHITEAAQTTQSEIWQLAERIATAKKSLSKMTGGKCPLCGKNAP